MGAGKKDWRGIAHKLGRLLAKYEWDPTSKRGDAWCYMCGHSTNFNHALGCEMDNALRLVGLDTRRDRIRARKERDEENEVEFALERM